MILNFGTSSVMWPGVIRRFWSFNIRHPHSGESQNYNLITVKRELIMQQSYPVSKEIWHQKYQSTFSQDFCSIGQMSIAQWEALLSLTHNPLTNIVYSVSASSCLWLFKCVYISRRGCLTHVIGSASEAADENGSNALAFLLASYERSR